jgi:hypothetical protein
MTQQVMNGTLFSPKEFILLFLKDLFIAVLRYEYKVYSSTKTLLPIQLNVISYAAAQVHHEQK